MSIMLLFVVTTLHESSKELKLQQSIFKTEYTGSAKPRLIVISGLHCRNPMMVTLSGDRDVNMGPGLVMSHNLITHYSCDHTQVNIIHHYTFQIIVHIKITVFRTRTDKCIKALILSCQPYSVYSKFKATMYNFNFRNIYFWP